jgi:hypothetical protein
MAVRHAYRGLVLTWGMIEYGELSFKVVRLEPGGRR